MNTLCMLSSLMTLAAPDFAVGQEAIPVGARLELFRRRGPHSVR